MTPDPSSTHSLAVLFHATRLRAGFPNARENEPPMTRTEASGPPSSGSQSRREPTFPGFVGERMPGKSLPRSQCGEQTWARVVDENASERIVHLVKRHGFLAVILTSVGTRKVSSSWLGANEKRKRMYRFEPARRVRSWHESRSRPHHSAKISIPAGLGHRQSHSTPGILFKLVLLRSWQSDRTSAQEVRLANLRGCTDIHKKRPHFSGAF